MHVRGKGLAGAFALAVSLLAAAGCEPYVPQAPEGQIQGQGSVEGRPGDVNLYRDIQFDDVPGPQGYVLNMRESYSFRGAAFRTAYLVYEGPLDWAAALDFYRAEMPRTGWAAETQPERGYDFRVLRFTKGQERAIVTVRQIRGGSRTEIQIDNIEQNDLLLKGRLPAP